MSLDLGNPPAARLDMDDRSEIDDDLVVVAERSGISLDIIRTMHLSQPTSTPINQEAPLKIKQESVYDFEPDSPIRLPPKSSYKIKNDKPLNVQQGSADNIQQEKKSQIIHQGAISESDKPGGEIELQEIGALKFKVSFPKIERETIAKSKSERNVRPKQESKVKIKLENVYNLRRASRRVDHGLRADGVWLNRRLSASCFRERILSRIDFEKYHQNALPDDEYAPKILDLSRKTQRSQIDSFQIQDRQFIVIAWLSVIRIFEYDPKGNKYFEIKRLPQRYITFSSSLITAVLACDSKFYIANIANDEVDRSGTSTNRAFIEIRDVYGELQAKPYFYEHVIKSIHCNQSYIHVRTVRNIIYLHRRHAFDINPIFIDLSAITPEPIISFTGKALVSQQAIRCLIATSSQLLVSKLDGLNHEVQQIYDFKTLDDLRHSTIALHHLDNMVILHRNLVDTSVGNKALSKLDIGSMHKSIKKKSRDYSYFVHEVSLEFKYQIIQSELKHNGKSIFLFGRTVTQDGKHDYELGQLRIADLKPIWCTRLYNVNADTRFVIHADHLAFVQDQQHLFSMPLEPTQTELIQCSNCHVKHTHLNTGEHLTHPGIIRDFSVGRNSNLTCYQAIQE